MTALIDPEDSPIVSEPENDLGLRTLLGRANGTEDLSITWVQLEGRHRELRIGDTTRVYYILDGGFTFDVRGHPPMAASKGAIVVLDPRSTYSLGGSGEYLVINSPAYSDGDDLYLE